MQTPSRKVTFNPESSRKHDHHCVCQICTCGKTTLMQASTPALNLRHPSMPIPAMIEIINHIKYASRLRMLGNMSFQKGIMTLEYSNLHTELSTERCQ